MFMCGCYASIVTYMFCLWLLCLDSDLYFCVVASIITQAWAGGWRSPPTSHGRATTPQNCSQPPGPCPIAPKDEIVPCGETPHSHTYIYVYIYAEYIYKCHVRV